MEPGLGRVFVFARHVDEPMEQACICKSDSSENHSIEYWFHEWN